MLGDYRPIIIARKNMKKGREKEGKCERESTTAER
jgi:hypothetical protein